MKDFKQIRNASDITDIHVQGAIDMRDGLYGGEPLPWPDVIERLENNSGEDWGSDWNSPAIRELKRRVRAATGDRRD
jgi:hypothetical protein